MLHQSQKSRTTLGIDFGTKRVGLAISRLDFALPLKTIEANDQLLAELKKVIASHNIKQVVMGVSEKKSADLARKLGKKIEEELKINVAYADETLSSHEARERLKESGKRLKPKEQIDHYAAAIILENWLESNQLVNKTTQ